MSLGVEAPVDRAALARGIVKIDFVYTLPTGEACPMYAVFPDLYPYFRFEIFAPTIALPHHQNPIGKNLCLIGRGTANWNPDDTLASFIRDRLPLVLQAGQTEDVNEAELLEELQAEPVSTFYQYSNNSVIFVDSAWNIDVEISGGELVIGLEPGTEPSFDLFRGAVLEIRDASNRAIATSDPVWRERCKEVLTGHWARIPEAPPTSDPNEILRLLGREDSKRPSFRLRRIGGRGVGVIAVALTEEIAWRRRGTGWMFIVALSDRFHPKGRPMLVRAGRAGRTDFSARIPDLKSLTSQRVAVAGLGAIGAPSAMEFARCGVSDLRLLDHDVVESATAVRWPFGLSVAGRKKAEVLRDFIESDYPYTSVAVWDARLGAASRGPQSDIDVLTGFLKDVDLIYDASAELGLQYVLSDLAWDRGIAYVGVSTTFGAWGGVVIRILANPNAGCWQCWQYHQRTPLIPPAPSDPKGEVQPLGCAAPTYTGSSFDVGTVALTGVRVAVDTLLAKVMGQPTTSEVVTLSFRDNGPSVCRRAERRASSILSKMRGILLRSSHRQARSLQAHAPRTLWSKPGAGAVPVASPPWAVCPARLLGTTTLSSRHAGTSRRLTDSLWTI